jgi:carboxymethylenebutenolidase
MVVTTESVSIESDGSAMRLLVTAPRQEGRYPGIVAFSDIFQITGPMERICTRLTGYGFVVAAPEIYHRLEPPGTAIPFDDAGRERGLANAMRTRVAEFDADSRATLDYLSRHPQVTAGQLGAMGFCIGGHLAFRAATQPDVKATTCFYGTGIHNGKLGLDADARSLARAPEITGQLLMCFGALDPHVPAVGREAIAGALSEAGLDAEIRLYQGEHAFMRDEGPRYDPAATDEAFADMIGLFRRVFGPSS